MSKIFLLLLIIISSIFLHRPKTHSFEPPKTVKLWETRKRIAVIDTGVSRSQLYEKYMCQDMPVFSLPGTTSLDRFGHGTNVVGLVGERINSEKYCLTAYTLHDDKMPKYLTMLETAMSHNVVGVNLSWASEGYNKAEEDILYKMSKKKIKVFIASGNQRVNLDIRCNTYPACHKTLIPDLVVVGSPDRKYANYGSIVDVEYDGTMVGSPKMTGTSMSTAIATGTYFSK